MSIITLVLFLAFGFNMGCNGSWSKNIEAILGILVFSGVIATSCLNGFWFAIVTTFVGMLLAKVAYSFSPKLR